jgi:hypothetical protein
VQPLGCIKLRVWTQVIAVQMDFVQHFHVIEIVPELKKKKQPSITKLL